jgi:bifunctional non-homologous end joining protein LigD
MAQELAARHPKLMTVVFKVADRPRNTVLVDYNQNAWGHTLASVYSVRPRPRASVSAPVTWDEVQRGLRIEDFRVDNVPDRIDERGDLWAPVLSANERFPLERILG